MGYKELPERLGRKVIYESDYVCLYADKVRLPNGYIIEKYHQIHYPHEAVSIVGHAKAENMVLVTNNVQEFKRVPSLQLENWAE